MAIVKNGISRVRVWLKGQDLFDKHALEGYCKSYSGVNIQTINQSESVIFFSKSEKLTGMLIVPSNQIIYCDITPIDDQTQADDGAATSLD